MTTRDPSFIGDQLLRLRDVELKTGLSRSSIYRRLAEGTFPEPVRLTLRSVRWRASAVEAWIDGLAGEPSSSGQPSG